jgi:integrase
MKGERRSKSATLCVAEVDITRNDALLFPARGKPDKPFNGWSKAIKALREALGKDFKHFTLHDLRRTYRTIHGKIGTPPHIAERLVNHVQSRSEVEKIYDQWTYLPEMKTAVENYQRHVVSIFNGKSRKPNLA